MGKITVTLVTMLTDPAHLPLALCFVPDFIAADWAMVRRRGPGEGQRPSGA